MKISCNGKIPEATADERDRLQQLIRAGKSKVAQDTGMPDDTENFLVHEENEMARLERIEDSDLLPQKATSPTTETPTTTGYANIPLLTTMHMAASTGLTYPPTAMFPTQPPSNLYFNMENPQLMQPYHSYYPHYPHLYPYNSQYQSTFANSNHQSTSTNTNPQVQSNWTITDTSLNIPSVDTDSNQPTNADANSTLLDLAEAALQE